MKENHWQLFATTLGVLLALWAGSARAEFDHVFRAGFEETHTITTPVVNTVLPPGNQVTAPTPEGDVIIEAIGDAPATVIVGVGFSEFGETGTIIEVSGGPVSMAVTSPQQRGAVNCEHDPGDTINNYPVTQCWGTRNYFFVNIQRKTSGLIPLVIETIVGARLPGVQGVTGEIFEPPLVEEKREYFLWIPVAAQLNACSSSYCSGGTGPSDPIRVAGKDAVPVLLIHGYQSAPFGPKIGTNGGHDYYGKLPDRLIASGYYPLEFKWLTNARFSDAADDLAAAIVEIKNRTGKDVHIVAHSFGGLPVRSLIQRVVDGAYGGQHTDAAIAAIASVTTVGTPHSGIADNIGIMIETFFPKGQDVGLFDVFEACNQISCHIAGESALSNVMASILGVNASPGGAVHQLAVTRQQLPSMLRVRILMGLLWSSELTKQGDGLITGWGQRFHPSLALNGSGSSHAWQPLLDNSTAHGPARVTEIMLGRSANGQNFSGVAPESPRPSGFLGFKHSASTSGTHDKVQVNMEPTGFHDTYERILEGLPPTRVSLEVTPVSLEAGRPVTLARSSSNANGCHGTGVTRNGAIINLPFWTNQLLSPTGTTTGVLTEPGTYVFQMTCSNPTAGAAPVVSSQPVTVHHVPDVPERYCAEYYDGATGPVPTDPRFTAHGFAKVERPFSQVWGMPIDSSGLLAYANVPGFYLAGGPQYLSIPITLTPSIGRVRFDWTEPQGGTAPAPVAVTISPCPGDFRPRQTGTGDNFLNPFCRLSEVGMNDSLRIARAGTGLAGCQVPADKTVYLNIATYNLFQASGTPASTCASPPNCGVRMRVERME